jgi:hypothetical protein
MRQTLESDLNLMRFRCVNEEGEDLLFQSKPVDGDIRLLVYFELENLRTMLAPFADQAVDGVTCETTLLVQVRWMIDFGHSLMPMRAALQAATALVEEAINRDETAGACSDCGCTSALCVEYRLHGQVCCPDCGHRRTAHHAR